MTNLQISMIALLGAFMAITGYIINIASKNKAVKSISESNYWLKWPYKWIFEAVMFTCGIALTYAGAHALKEPTWMVIIGGLGITLVGVFSRFKKNLFFRIMHMVSAFGGFISIGFSFWISFNLWWVTVLAAVSVGLTYLYSKNKDVRIWNAEIIMVYFMFAALMIIYLMKL